MTVQAASGALATSNRPAGGAEPPPPPRLTAVEAGDVAAGRAMVVEGQVFSGTSPDAPATRNWGEQPAGSGYREAFDQVAARLGTRDPAVVGAEIDRQLFGTATPGAVAPTTSPAQPPASREEIGSVVEGAVMGDFGDNNSWSATAGQVGVGFVPVLGQIADARDTIASVGQVFRGEEGGWFNLGTAVIGWVPGVGDAAKAALRGGERVADAGGEIAQGAARQADPPAVDTPPSPRGDLPPSANGVPGATIAETAARTGIPEAKVREILDTPKESRPDPSTYMSADRISAHLRPFEESGAIKLTPQSSLDKHGTLGPPSGGFVLPRSEFERLVEETGGDLGKLEDALQMRPGELSSGDTVIAYIAPEDLRGLRVPSGGELGAWEGLWVPGGFTGRGVPEAVVDLPADVPYARVELGE